MARQRRLPLPPPPVAPEHGHAEHGHAGNGHAGNGHAGNGHAGNGHAGNGHAGNGHAEHGHAGHGGPRAFGYPVQAFRVLTRRRPECLKRAACRSRSFLPGRVGAGQEGTGTIAQVGTAITLPASADVSLQVQDTSFRTSSLAASGTDGDGGTCLKLSMLDGVGSTRGDVQKEDCAIPLRFAGF